ncbi:MAG TPA: metallophosphoesterase [Pseudomonadales bacterium]|nr:metallophosphoesterase [Pseudomonadales bacterium]
MAWLALRTTLTAALLALVLVPCGALARNDDESRWQWNDVARVVAFGDVHGDHDALVRLLTHAGVIDETGAWIGGHTHLVSLGDLLDRGPDSRTVMDLLMRLQDEARAAGGRVHVALGNHEQMNLTGDLRYVAAEEYAAFAGPEDDALRARAEAAADASGYGAEAVRRMPPGFFAHRAAFLPDGTYGRWLLAQRVMVMIDGRVFLHGGLSPVITDQAADPAAFEAALRARLRRLVELREEPELLRPRMLAVDLLQLGGASTGEAPALDEALAERLRAAADDPLFGSHGPFWHRGNAACHPLLETPALARSLSSLGARAVVVGHTVQRDHRVHVRLDGRAYLIDTGMLRAYYRGEPRALVIEGDAVRVLSPDGSQVTPDRERPAVDAGRDADALARLLEAGVASPLEDGAMRLALDGDAVRVQALRLGRRERQHELAAYRLDRALGLGMVPAVAERELDGRQLLLRLDEGVWISEAERVAQRRAVPNWCAAGHAFDLVRLFDLLIGNARSAEGLAYARDDLDLRLTAHGDAFGRSARLPDGAALPPVLAPVLRSLTPERVRAALAGILDERRIDAVLQRRSALLDRLGEN